MMNFTLVESFALRYVPRPTLIQKQHLDNGHFFTSKSYERGNKGPKVICVHYLWHPSLSALWSRDMLLSSQLIAVKRWQLIFLCVYMDAQRAAGVVAILDHLAVKINRCRLLLPIYHDPWETSLPCSVAFLCLIKMVSESVSWDSPSFILPNRSADGESSMLNHHLFVETWPMGAALLRRPTTLLHIYSTIIMPWHSSWDRMSLILNWLHWPYIHFSGTVVWKSCTGDRVAISTTRATFLHWLLGFIL